MISNYLTEAIQACEQAVEKHQENPSLWQSSCLELGNLLQGMARFDEAISWHSMALESKPNLVEVRTNLGKLYALENNWRLAINNLTQAIKINPKCAEAYSYLAQIYALFDRKDEEMELWYRALALKPRGADAEGHYRLAQAFQEKGKLNKAIGCYKRSIQLDHNFLAPYYYLAEIYTQKGDFDAAISYYQKALIKDANQAMAYQKMGNLWLQKGNYEEAIAAFRSTIQLEPEFPWAYRDLVKTLMQLSRWSEAIATCHGILNLVHEFPWVYVQMGNALLKLEQENEAISCFQKACKLRGWHLCPEKNYQFTQDFFSHKIPIWESHLQVFMDRSDLQFLEIGNAQGMSTCWLLDRILTHPSAKLTCLDTQFTEEFDRNLEKNGSTSKVTKIAGKIHSTLSSLIGNVYDLINLQDRCKLSEHIYNDAVLSWQLLKVGGLIFFNSYGWINDRDPEQTPKLGIDKFLNSIPGQFEIIKEVPHAHQLIIRRIK